jgi:hypothetical protein
MIPDRAKFRQEAATCLAHAKPASELVDCVAKHFPDLIVNRENDDLIIKAGSRYLVVRRSGPDHFRVSENVAVPSTNLIDFGGGAERSLDQLLDELSALAD